MGNLSDKYISHIHKRLALINLDKNDFDAAEKHLSFIRDEDTEVIDLNYIKAKILTGRNELIDAIEAITPALDKWNDMKYDSTLCLVLDDLLCFTAELFFRTNDIEGANQLYKAALQYNNKNADACFGAAKCFISAGATEEARTMLEWALKLRPDFEEARQELEKLVD